MTNNDSPFELFEIYLEACPIYDVFALHFQHSWLNDISGNYVNIIFSFLHMHHKFIDLNMFFCCSFLNHDRNHIYIQSNLKLALNHLWTPRLSSIYFFQIVMQGSELSWVQKYYPSSQISIKNHFSKYQWNMYCHRPFHSWFCLPPHCWFISYL